MKTIAARMLDQMKINYELRSYEVDENELDAITVANLRKLNELDGRRRDVESNDRS